MGVSEQVVLTCCKESTHGCHITCAQVDDSQIAKARFGEDNARDYKHGACDKSTDSVGEDVLEHNSAVASAQCSCNKHVFLILEAVELHSCTTCHTRPTCKEE